MVVLLGLGGFWGGVFGCGCTVVFVLGVLGLWFGFYLWICFGWELVLLGFDVLGLGWILVELVCLCCFGFRVWFGSLFWFGICLLVGW